VLRPHQLRLVGDHEPGWEANVEAVSYVGNLMSYLLRTDRGTPVYIEHMADAQPVRTQGARVRIAFDGTRVNVLEPVS
jgi:putative spermidine/putrescine transport system ATP-binding protein